MNYAIILKDIGQGTKTFKFSTLEPAQQLGESKMNRLVDIMEWNGQKWVSIF